jgi:hypothetical protein
MLTGPSRPTSERPSAQRPQAGCHRWKVGTRIGWAATCGSPDGSDRHSPLIQLNLPVGRLLRRVACSGGLMRREHGIAFDCHPVGVLYGSQSGGHPHLASGDGLAVLRPSSPPASPPSSATPPTTPAASALTWSDSSSSSAPATAKNSSASRRHDRPSPSSASQDHPYNADYSLSFDGQFAAVTPHRTASSVVRQRRWRVAIDRRLAERLLRGAGIEAPARCAACTERQSADPHRLTRAPQAGRRVGRPIRRLPGPVRRGPGGRGLPGWSGSVRVVVACLAVLVWPPAARRLARPGSRRSRLLRWTGPGSARTRRQATKSTRGRSR